MNRPTTCRLSRTDLVCLALLVLIALSMGRALLITALNMPETLARAEAVRAM